MAACLSRVFVVAPNGDVTPVQMRWSNDGVAAVTPLTDLGIAFDPALDLFSAGALCTH